MIGSAVTQLQVLKVSRLRTAEFFSNEDEGEEGNNQYVSLPHLIDGFPCFLGFVADCTEEEAERVSISSFFNSSSGNLQRVEMHGVNIFFAQINGSDHC
jgi:hypothetical protein